MAVFKVFYSKMLSDYQIVKCSVWIYNITKVIQCSCRYTPTTERIKSKKILVIRNKVMFHRRDEGRTCLLEILIIPYGKVKAGYATLDVKKKQAGEDILSLS